MTVIDADAHVTESAEQGVKYMDAPFRNRQLVFPIVPADGWDRRLLTKYRDTAGTADAWLRALDKGGMEQAVLFPTLGLFMSFLKDRASRRWPSCRSRTRRPRRKSSSAPSASSGTSARCSRRTAATFSATSVSHRSTKRPSAWT